MKPLFRPTLLSLLLGAPPYVVWLQIGNTDKTVVLRLLLDNAEAVQEGFARGLACVELAEPA